MCFAAEQMVTALVTTHLPLSKVSRALSQDTVCESTVQLAKLLRRLGHEKPLLFVCSLNPHAGESELFGVEEERAILPGIRAARRVLGNKAKIVGPIGAETAYRKAYAAYHEVKGQPGIGVVAMYHDQATIPTKLVAFGDAVNVTMGLSIVRTSVDHGTGYDIAWQGRADDKGMLSAARLALRLIDRRNA
jgi:4-hydroxythreonine-4-phosphate dehydrogenase